MGNPSLIIIVGPTGVGKTETAIKLARIFAGEVISADSMQVYRYMDIGTAKPPIEERRAIRHHLIDVVDPDEAFNAALFLAEAKRIIGELRKKGKTIFVVGGTGLYIDVLLGGLLEGPGADVTLRHRYKSDLEKYGIDYLYEALIKKDRRAAEKIHPHDAVRIVRAMEVIDTSGESIVGKQEEHKFQERLYNYIKIGLIIDREELYQRINERTDRMIQDGLAEEVKGLMKMGYDESLKPMQSMCYRHMIDYLKGKHDREEAIRLVKRDTRHYAKRQLTWFKKDDDIEWFHPRCIEPITKEIKNFIAG